MASRFRLSTSLHAVACLAGQKSPTLLSKPSSDASLARPNLIAAPLLLKVQVLPVSRVPLAEFRSFRLSEDFDHILKANFSQLNASDSGLSTIEMLRMCFASHDSQISLSAVAVAGLALESGAGTVEITSLLSDGDTYVVANTCAALINCAGSFQEYQNSPLAKELLKVTGEEWSEIAQHFAVLPSDAEQRLSILSFFCNVSYHKDIVANILKTNATGTMCVRILGHDWQGRFSSTETERQAMLSLINGIVTSSKAEEWKRICEDICVFESMSAFFLATSSPEHACMVLSIVQTMCQDIQFVHYFAGKDASFTHALVQALNEKTQPAVQLRLARVCGAFMQDYGGLKNLISGGVFKFFASCLTTSNNDELLIAILTALGNLALSEELPSNHAAVIKESKILAILCDMISKPNSNTSDDVRHLCSVAISNLMTLESLHVPFAQGGGVKVLIETANKVNNPPTSDQDADLFQRCLAPLFHLSFYHDPIRLLVVQEGALKIYASVIAGATTPLNNVTAEFCDSMDKARGSSFRTLLNISMTEGVELELVKQNVIAPLVAVLKSTSSSGPKDYEQKSAVIGIFENIAHGIAFQDHLLSNEYLDPIVAMVENRSALIQQRSARLLARLATHNDTRKYLQTHDVIPILEKVKETNATMDVQTAIEAAIVNISVPVEDQRASQRKSSGLSLDGDCDYELLQLTSEFDVDDDGSIANLEKFILDSAPQSVAITFDRPRLTRANSNVSSSSASSSGKRNASPPPTARSSMSILSPPPKSPTLTPTSPSFPSVPSSRTSSCASLPSLSGLSSPATSNPPTPRPAIPPKPNVSAPRPSSVRSTSAFPATAANVSAPKSTASATAPIPTTKSDAAEAASKPNLPPKPRLKSKLKSDGTVAAGGALDAAPPRKTSRKRLSEAPEKRNAPVAPPRAKVDLETLEAAEIAAAHPGSLSAAAAASASSDTSDHALIEGSTSSEDEEEVDKYSHEGDTKMMSSSEGFDKHSRKRKKSLFSSIKHFFSTGESQDSESHHSPSNSTTSSKQSSRASIHAIEEEEQILDHICPSVLYDYYDHWCSNCKQLGRNCTENAENLRLVRMRLIRANELKTYAPVVARRVLARSTSDPMPNISNSSLELDMTRLGLRDDTAAKPSMQLRSMGSIDSNLGQDGDFKLSSASSASFASNRSSVSETKGEAIASKFGLRLPPLTIPPLTQGPGSKTAIPPQKVAVIGLQTPSLNSTPSQYGGLAFLARKASFGGKKALPADADPETVKRAKMHVKRTHVAQELLSTEVTYMQNLQIMIKKFQSPLIASLATPKPLISETDIKIIFGSIDLIYNVNIVLMEKLSAKVRLWNSKQTLGDVFVYMADWFKVYTDYINNYDQAQSTLLRCKEESPRFAQFLHDRSLEPICAMRGLESFLVTPIQRLPRYGLLLRELIKATEETHPDFKDLQKAVSRIDEITRYLNEKRREFDVRLKMLALAHSLKRTKTRSQIVLPHRENLLDSPVDYTLHGENKGGSGRIYLLNDAVLLTRQVGKTRQKVVRLIPFLDVTANLPPIGSTSSDYELTLLHVSEQEFVSVFFDSGEERNTFYEVYLRSQPSL